MFTLFVGAVGAHVSWCAWEVGQVRSVEYLRLSRKDILSFGGQPFVVVVAVVAVLVAVVAPSSSCANAYLLSTAHPRP